MMTEEEQFEIGVTELPAQGKEMLENIRDEIESYREMINNNPLFTHYDVAMRNADAAEALLQAAASLATGESIEKLPYAARLTLKRALEAAELLHEHGQQEKEKFDGNGETERSIESPEGSGVLREVREGSEEGGLVPLVQGGLPEQDEEDPMHGSEVLPEAVGAGEHRTIYGDGGSGGRVEPEAGRRGPGMGRRSSRRYQRRH